jgi:hypothetical protein
MKNNSLVHTCVCIWNNNLNNVVSFHISTAFAKFCHSVDLSNFFLPTMALLLGFYMFIFARINDFVIGCMIDHGENILFPPCDRLLSNNTLNLKR